MEQNMKKEKTIYIVSQLGISNAGGVEKVSYYLNEILSKNHNVKIITKGKCNFGKLNNLIQPLIISLRLRFLKNKFVIGNSWHCFLYPADISIHHGTSAGIMEKTGESNMSLKLTAWMEKISARRARKVMAVSENCKKELTSLYGIPESKIMVVNNFVDDQVFKPAENATEAGGENKKVINVCFSGALLEKKGLERLKSFSDYMEEYAGRDFLIELNIATNYSKNAEYFQGRQHTHIRTGLTSKEMPDFYRENHIMFFPTKYEGFSMAVLEALSSGLCLVGSHFAVTPEVQKYDFCHLINSETSNEELVNIIINLYQKFADKKLEIHNQIKNDSGKEQYVRKIEELI